MGECPACGGDRFTREQVLPDLGVLTCTTCGLLLSDIATAQSIGYADVDAEAYRQSIGVVRERQAAEILHFVRPHVPSGDWLDAGCGFGYLLREAKKAGYGVAGLEPDPNAVQAALALVGDVVRQGTMNDVQDSADVISTLDVLEHVPMPALGEFAQTVRRHLRPGGVWVIKVPSTEGLFFRIAGALRLPAMLRRLWQSGYEYPHTVYFDRRTLGTFVNRHGFEVVAARYLEDVPSATAYARMRVDPSTPRWLAVLSVPAFYAINFIERMRGKSDALLLLARVTSPPRPS